MTPCFVNIFHPGYKQRHITLLAPLLRSPKSMLKSLSGTNTFFSSCDLFSMRNRDHVPSVSHLKKGIEKCVTLNVNPYFAHKKSQ